MNILIDYFHHNFIFEQNFITFVIADVDNIVLPTFYKGHCPKPVAKNNLFCIFPHTLGRASLATPRGRSES